MDLHYSQEYEAFRAEVRAFLDEHWTAEDRGGAGEEVLIGSIKRPSARETEFRSSIASGPRKTALRTAAATS